MNLFDGITEDVANAPTLGPVNPGTYLARIEFLKCGLSKKSGKHYITVTLDLTEEETAQRVDHFLGIVPREEPDEKLRGKYLRNLQSFIAGFNLPPDILEDENWEPIQGDETKLMNRKAVGAQAMVVLKLADKKDENKQPTGEKENTVSAIMPLP
jgi:hypothetical protein